MMVFEKIRKWLGGTYTCRYCRKEFHIMAFGTGEAICPHCYDGEDQFIFPDKDNILNRVVWGLINLDDMDSDEVYCFLNQVKDSMTALSNLGFSIVCQIPDAPSEPTIIIRSES